MTDLSKRAFQYALITFLALRLFTSLVVLAATYNIAPNPPPAPYSPAVVADLEQRGEWMRRLVLPWYRWDSTHYVEMADFGYSSKMENTVWPPLYPALIHLFSLVFKPTMLAALVVSNLAALVVFFLLYLLVTEVWDEKTARHTVLWMAIFPTGFFLLAGYTESLFLAFSLGTLLAARRRRWLLTGLLGMLATLTRIPGILLSVPVLWEAWQALRQPDGRLDIKATIKTLASLVPIPLSLAAYSAYVHFGLGADWPWSTLASNWHLRTAWPWVGLVGTLNLMAHSPIDPNAVSRFYDVLLSLWALLMLAIGMRKLPTTYVLYSAVLLLTALVKVLDNNALMSVSRYILPLFPLMIIQDRLLPVAGSRLLWAAFCTLSQALLIVLFYGWIWVA